MVRGRAHGRDRASPWFGPYACRGDVYVVQSAAEVRIGVLVERVCSIASQVAAVQPHGSDEVLMCGVGRLRGLTGWMAAVRGVQRAVEVP